MQDIDKMLHLTKLNPGMILGDQYQIIREIARGGMGIVYEAYDNDVHRKVAIKVILANKVDSIQLKRFQKEIEACVRLSHPNVVRIYDSGTYDNNPYIVMEYIEGVNICQYVAQHDQAYGQNNTNNANDSNQERDWKLCAKLIYETALALEYIHKQKMFHRDIKPTNILVRDDGSPVIIDLGLVKFNQERSYNLTRTKDIIGTCQYMSIEQAQGKHGVIDARSDVYSLGLVLYELLAEQRAYSGKNMADVFNKIMSYYPPSPKEINPQVPEILNTITLKATEKRRNKRYQTAQEFANALLNYLNNQYEIPCNTKKVWLQNHKKSCICIVICFIIAFILGIVFYPKSPQKNYELAKKYYNNNKFEKALYLYERAGNQGHAEAQFNLGLLYDQGKGVEQNAEKAILWYEKAGNQGHVEAQFNLGVLYDQGKIIKQDLEKAILWYEKAGNQGHIEAQFNLGVLYAEKKKETVELTVKDLQSLLDKEAKKNDKSKNQVRYVIIHANGNSKERISKAIYWYEKAADQGHIQAQFKLGTLYDTGKGIKQDLAKAFYWYEKSANQGYMIAQFNLGVFYENGKGIEQNLEKALYWYEKSANQGYAKAQFNLGVFYENGKGGKQDLEKAFYWYEKSANQGYVDAQNNLGNFYYNEKYVKQDFEKAFYWYEKSANQNSMHAQFNLGMLYENGKGVKQDFKKAFDLYEKSANQGYSKAQFNLGVFYENGKGVKQDFKKAFDLYEKSANQGYSKAQFNLGYFYEYGKGIKQDLKKAFDLYEKSANQGYANAQNNLGNLYYNGIYVKEDFLKAFILYEKSANQGNMHAQFNLGMLYENGKGVKKDLEKAFYWYEKAANQGFTKAQNSLGRMYEKGQGVKQDLEKAKYWYEKAKQNK